MTVQPELKDPQLDTHAFERRMTSRDAHVVQTVACDVVSRFGVLSHVMALELRSEYQVCSVCIVYTDHTSHENVGYHQFKYLSGPCSSSSLSS
jgi:hypothetical protein